MAVQGRWAEGVQRPSDLGTTINEDKQQTILEPTPSPGGLLNTASSVCAAGPW